MPVDNKRIQGPEDTQPYSIFLKGGVKHEAELSKHLLDAKGLRGDGRAPLKQRGICELPFDVSYLFSFRLNY